MKDKIMCIVAMSIAVFSLGLVAASAMVIPGISGSLILMLLGYYEYILGTVKNVIFNVLQFNFAAIDASIWVVLLFAVGVLIGLIGCSKLISIMLKKHGKITGYAVFGLLVASTIALIISMCKNYANTFSQLNVMVWVCATICLILGFTFGRNNKWRIIKSF